MNYSILTVVICNGRSADEHREDLPWQSTNERSHDAEMFAKVSGRLAGAKPPYYSDLIFGRLHAELSA
ncbi:hypothetical protein [Methylotuvimicrobium sp. KM1]|uniref:hypothetical protein n=1 Tax=Methylotuvimicrobium sp. KM1 TaxID=3377707 RepID=UPI00384D1180